MQLCGVDWLHPAGSNSPFQHPSAPAGKCRDTELQHEGSGSIPSPAASLEVAATDHIRGSWGDIGGRQSSATQKNPIPNICAPCRANQDHLGTFQHGCHRGGERRAALPGAARSPAGHQLHLVLQRDPHGLPEGRFSLREGWRGELPTPSLHLPCSCSQHKVLFSLMLKIKMFLF